MSENQSKEMSKENIDNKDVTKCKQIEKQNISIKILLFLILAMLTILTVSNITGLKDDDKKWEYKVVYLESTEIEEYIESDFNPKEVKLHESMINSYGENGWELVDTYLEMETSHPNYGNSDYVTGLQPNVRPQRLVLIFKKPLIEPQDNEI